MVTLAVHSQEEVVIKSFSVKESDKITLEFKYPELVQIKTWDKNEVQIKATLYINDGKDNDSFELTSEANRDGLTVSSQIKSIDKFKNTSYYIGRDSNDEENEDVMIPRNGTSIRIGNGKPGSHNGVRISVVLEVIVPKNAELLVNAQYGMVEVIDLPKTLNIQAKYGGADIALSEASVESLWAATSWGQIYSNLSQEMTIGGNDMLGKEMTARIERGSGKKMIKVDSEYGNVFLRKN